MGFIEIDPYKKISQQQMFQLYFFSKIAHCQVKQKYDYITEFHITESLINEYNSELAKYHTITDKQSLVPTNYNELDINDYSNIFFMFDKRDVYNQLASVNEDDKVKFFNSITEKYIKLKEKFNNRYQENYRIEAKPVVWNITRNHNNYMCNQIELGARMEIFIDREFKKNGLDIGFYYDPSGQNKGECTAGIEIKHDMMYPKTGNFYIELCESHNINKNSYVASGLLKDDNSNLWIIGVPEDYYIVRKDDLKKLLTTINIDDKTWQNGLRFAESKVGSGWSKGFLVKGYKIKEIAISKDITEFTKKYIKKEIEVESKDNQLNNNVNKYIKNFTPNDTRVKGMDI